MTRILQSLRTQGKINLIVNRTSSMPAMISCHQRFSYFSDLMPYFLCPNHSAITCHNTPFAALDLIVLYLLFQSLNLYRIAAIFLFQATNLVILLLHPNFIILQVLPIYEIQLYLQPIMLINEYFSVLQEGVYFELKMLRM